MVPHDPIGGMGDCKVANRVVLNVQTGQVDGRTARARREPGAPGTAEVVRVAPARVAVPSC
jgi:hypothetical protein